MVLRVSIGRLVSWFSLVAVLLGSMVMTFAVVPAKEFPSPYDDLCIVPAVTVEPEPAAAAHAVHDATAPSQHAGHTGHTGHAGHAGHDAHTGQSAHWHDSMVDHCLPCQFRAGRGGPVPHRHAAVGPALPDIGLPTAVFVASAQPAARGAIPRREPTGLY